MNKIEQRIYEIIGEASMCWSETQKGIFDSTKAKELAEEIMTHIKYPIKEEKCYSCGGKGTYSQIHGIHGAEDFGGDGYENKPSIHNYPCKACNGTGLKPNDHIRQSPKMVTPEEKKKLCPLCNDFRHSNKQGVCRLHEDLQEMESSTPKGSWHEREREDIETMVRDFCSVVPKSKSEVRSRLNILTSQAEERIRLEKLPEHSQAVNAVYESGKQAGAREAIEVYGEYVKFLENHINGNAVYLSSHGIHATPGDIQKGKELRIKIGKLRIENEEYNTMESGKEMNQLEKAKQAGAREAIESLERWGRSRMKNYEQSELSGKIEHMKASLPSDNKDTK